MAIRPASVVRPYDLIWSGDPALTLAPIPPEPVALPSEPAESLRDRVAAWKQDTAAILARNAELYDRALETGDWSPILKPGETPTKFRVRQIPGSVRRVLDRVWAGTEWREQVLFAFRLAVIDIIDGPIGSKIELSEHVGIDGKPTGLGPALPVEVCDALDRITLAIINDLGILIMQQKGAPPGK